MSRAPARYDRAILALALPALGALAADPLVSLVDTAIVGRLGATPLAALGVNTSLFSLAFVAFNFLAYGTTPMVGRALGRGDRQGAGRVVVQALTLAVVAGVAALVLLQLAAVPLLRAMGADGALLAPALTYLRIRALAGPALLLIEASNGAFRGFLDTRTPLIVTVGLNLVNLVLDPLFIFGFGWGLAGAALATAIAQWLGAAGFLLALFTRRGTAIHLPVALPRPRELVPFLRVGGEMLLRTGSLVGTQALATAVAARVGVAQVAAHQVAAQLWLFLALTIDALAVAGQGLVATYRGGDRPGDARAVSDRLLLLGLAVGVVLGLGFWALGPWLPRLFTSDGTVLATVHRIYPFVVAMQPLNGLVFVWDGIFMGAEAFGFLARAMLVSAAAAVVVLLLVVPMGWGLTGVWWGLVTLIVVRALTQGWKYWGSRPLLPREA
ncbi:MAG: MATE family efflux transporter [Deinococcales bacterium]